MCCRCYRRSLNYNGNISWCVRVCVSVCAFCVLHLVCLFVVGGFFSLSLCLIWLRLFASSEIYILFFSFHSRQSRTTMCEQKTSTSLHTQAWSRARQPAPVRPALTISRWLVSVDEPHGIWRSSRNIAEIATLRWPHVSYNTDWIIDIERKERIWMRIQRNETKAVYNFLTSMMPLLVGEEPGLSCTVEHHKFGIQFLV